MTWYWHQNMVRWTQVWKHSSIGTNRRRRGSCAAQLLLITMLLAIIVISSIAHDSIVYQAQETPPSSFYEDTQLQKWRGKQVDEKHAQAKLDGVRKCSEVVNVRVDSEFFKDEMLISCRHETGGYDITDLLHTSENLTMPSKEQLMKLCRSKACATWLNQAVKARWLPECRYRNSQMSFRSLAESILQTRENLAGANVEGAGVPAAASLFREFYELTQLANLPSAKKEGVLDEIVSPVMQVTRKMKAEDDFRLMTTGNNIQSDTGVELRESMSGSSIPSSAAILSSASESSTPISSATVGASGSTSNLNSVEETLSFSSARNSSDAASFSNSDAGPHASSTTTTTDLTPSYAYVIGAWILFNASYLLLMRRK